MINRGFMITLFADVLRVSVISGILILLIAAVSPLMSKKHSVFWRYVLWIFLSIRLILPFEASFLKPAFIIPISIGTETENALNVRMEWLGNVLKIAWEQVKIPISAENSAGKEKINRGESCDF